MSTVCTSGNRGVALSTGGSSDGLYPGGRKADTSTVATTGIFCVVPSVVSGSSEGLNPGGRKDATFTTFTLSKRLESGFFSVVVVEVEVVSVLL